MSKKILLIAGHGEGDPGACSKWGQEANYTRELATLVQKSIGNTLEVTMYPQNQNCYYQSQKGNAPRYQDFDFTLEIHFNAKTIKDENGDGRFTGDGGYYHPNNTGRSLADNMVNSIAHLGFKVWGNFTSTGLLNLNRAQSAGAKYFLLETAFIDDGDDMAWYTANKSKVAKCIAQVLISGLGASGSAGTPDIPEAELYRVRRSWEDVKSQLFAGTLAGAKKCCPTGYSVYNSKGKSVYTNTAKGTQATTFKNCTEADFVKIIGALCRVDQRTSGILACITAAQAILESGYGKTDLAQGANNLFGMKCILSGNTWPDTTWDGKSKYTKRTQEQTLAGKPYYVTADFRKYPNVEDSIADHSAYLLGAANGSKQRYAGLAGEKDYRKAAQLIKNGGYATDINYVEKLCNIIKKWNLTQFNVDAVQTPEPPETNLKPSPEKDNWVERLQAELNTQGFRDRYGDKLNADNIAGELTLSACPTVRSGARGGLTKLIQERLGERFKIGVSGGYDGAFGAGTKAAVMELQKQKGLAIDGIVGKNTWRVLLK